MSLFIAMFVDLHQRGIDIGNAVSNAVQLTGGAAGTKSFSPFSVST